jgi:hypothetical protein
LYFDDTGRWAFILHKAFSVMVTVGILGFFIVKLFFDDSLQDIRFWFAGLLFIGMIGKALYYIINKGE